MSDGALDRADAELLSVLDRDFRAAAAKAGKWLRCAAGCNACCHGPFPITRLDVRRLSRGLAELERSDPDRARQVFARADRALLQLSTDYPGDSSTGRLTEDVAELDRYFERHENLPCPALDPETGCCDLYDARPVACRTHGPPLRIGAETVPPCQLCFEGAPLETLEACRMEPDPEGREEAMLRALDAQDAEDWETVVAFALVRG